MRAKNDVSYMIYKDGVNNVFNRWKKGIWTPEECVNCLIDEDQGYFVGTSVMLWILSIGEYEVRHDILEDRILNNLSYHIYRYENMSKYKDDLTDEEIAEVEKDIEFIKSKVELQELVSYEDKELEPYDPYEPHRN